MDFEKLLAGVDCACGKKHTCDIKHVVIEKGAIKKIPALVANYKNILVVADQNTYAVCGEKVLAELGDKLQDKVVFDCEGYLVPNEDAIDAVTAKVTKDTDLIMAIGSGVMQDLCKCVSFEAKLPYHVIATAPSMDGYASTGAAMILNQMKVTVSAHVPEVIVGDVDVLKDAPMDLIQSGYGDILGKFSCLNDWKLSAVINDEYICEYVYDLTFDMLNKVKDIPEKLLARDEDAIQTLMEALVGVGIAMAFVGNSRPASGSEHHLSHFFEITGLLDGTEYFLHGIDVVFSAVYTQKLRDELLELDAANDKAPLSDADYEAAIKKIYYSAADGVIALQNKLGWYKIDKSSIYKEKWAQIKEVLKEAPSAEVLKNYITRVGLNIADFEERYGAEKIQNAIWFAKDLKDRYTVLWLYFDLKYGK